MLTTTHAKGLADLPPVINDSLLALIALCNADPRPEKIDVGVGVFRDAVGNTPILKVMKEAEQRLLDTQVTKAYLGSGGDVKAQTKQVLDNISATLKTAGSSLANAASVTVYLKTPADFAAMNEVYRAHAGERPPARSTVQVAALPSGACVEIEAVAHV